MASPLSFHCIICCEPFNNSDTYPVVLPCGHTYICIICGERLERCMECRESLFLPEEKPINNTCTRVLHPATARYQYGRSSSAYSTRSSPARHSGYYRSTQQVRSAGSLDTPVKDDTPVKKERKRFPLPKNLVLLSLMETVAKAGENERKATRLLANTEDCTHATDEADEEEINTKVIASLASTTYGTYAVSSKLDVPIFTLGKGSEKIVEYKPISNRRTSFKKKVSAIKKEPRSVLDEMDLNSKSVFRQNNLKTAQHSAPIDMLHYGDKIQVVSVIDGWAILAREKGIVAIDKLVKVSGPIDEACRLEGILISLMDRKESLVKQQSETKKVYDALQKDMQSALSTEDLTITRAPVKEKEISKSSDEESSKSPPGSPSSVVPNEIEIERKPSTDSAQKRNAEKKYHTPNFRTGMSGHSGIGHYASARGERARLTRSNIMSNHRGLSIPRNAFRSFYGSDKRDVENSPAKSKSTPL